MTCARSPSPWLLPAPLPRSRLRAIAVTPMRRSHWEGEITDHRKTESDQVKDPLPARKWVFCFFQTMKPLPEPGPALPVFARKVPRGFTAEPRSISQRPHQIPRPPNPGPRQRATGKGRGCVFFCEGRPLHGRLHLFEQAPALVPRPGNASPHRFSQMPAGGRKPAGDCFAPPSAAGESESASVAASDVFWRFPFTLTLTSSLNPAVTEGGCRRSLPAPSDLRLQDNCAACAAALIGVFLIVAAAPGPSRKSAQKLQLARSPCHRSRVYS